MGKSTTSYKVLTVNGDEAAEVATKSKKSVAVDLARETRKAGNTAVRVETNHGTVVFEMPAPKKIKMSPRYTRVVDLPEGVTVPKGKRVAYFRPRRNGAILHDGETYTILNVTTNKELDETFETTRAAGARLKAGV